MLILSYYLCKNCFMTWPPSIAALERRAPWGSGASAMAHMMKPQIILLKAR